MPPLPFSRRPAAGAALPLAPAPPFLLHLAPPLPFSSLRPSCAAMVLAEGDPGELWQNGIRQKGIRQERSQASHGVVRLPPPPRAPKVSGGAPEVAGAARVRDFRLRSPSSVATSGRRRRRSPPPVAAATCSTEGEKGRARKGGVRAVGGWVLAERWAWWGCAVSPTDARCVRADPKLHQI
jgi:hypothetical protein